MPHSTQRIERFRDKLASTERSKQKIWLVLARELHKFLARCSRPKIVPRATTLDLDPFESRICYLGGEGNAAHWEWAILEKGSTYPLVSGLVRGQRKHAALAAQDAMLAYRQQQNASALRARHDYAAGRQVHSRIAGRRHLPEALGDTGSVTNWMVRRLRFARSVTAPIEKLRELVESRPHPGRGRPRKSFFGTGA